MSTTLEKLVLKYPNGKWDWKMVSQNPCITIQFIKEHPEFPWDSDELSWNPNITEEFIKNTQWNWNIKRLCSLENPNLSLEFLFKLCGGEDYISDNKFITLSFIDKHPTASWNWDYVSANVPLQDIINNPDKPWNWEFVSLNPNLTEEFLEQNVSKPWDWWQLSKHQNITIEFVERHINCKWEIGALSDNPNLTIEFVVKHDRFEWDWESISMNPGITYQDMKNNPLIPWNKENVSANENITHCIVFKDFCSNGNITPEILEQNYDDIDWGYLSGNIFERNTERYKSVRSRKRVKIVQKWWRTTRKQRVFKELDDVINVTDLAHYVVSPRRGR